MAMQAGKLRHRVTIQRLSAGSPGQDAGGTPDDGWGALFTCWAEVMPLRGRELVAAQQVHPEVTGTIRIRYRADYPLTSKDRAVYDSRIYDILAAINVEERNREVLLYVKEGPNAG
jgi:SPP1 family predicted phage head-tail adaptor